MALGNSGSADIPPFVYSYASSTAYTIPNLYVSNITDNDINVKLTFYKDGNRLTDDNSQSAGLFRAQGNISNYYDNLTDASVSFTLAPKSTAVIRLYGDSNSYIIYGKIEWSQDNSSVVHGLLCRGDMSWRGSNQSMWPISINGDLSF